MFDGLAMPELIVRDVVEAALRAMLASGPVLDLMMAGRPAAERDTVRTMLTVRPGKVRLSFPVEPKEDWEVSIALGSTAKTAVIGDQTSDIEEEPIGDPALLTAAINASEDLALPIAGVPAGIPPKGRCRLEDEVAIYEVVGSTVMLRHRGIGGTAAASHAAMTGVVFHTISQRVGWPQTEHLRVDVLSTSALFTVVVGHMLAAFLASRRDDFEAQGMTLSSVTQTDLAPRPATWPPTFYARTLMLETRTEMALPEDFPALTDVFAELTAETDLVVEQPELS